MIKLITINGPLGSGKSWTADRIQDLYPYPVTKRLGFQDKLAEIVRLMFDVPADVKYDEFKKTEFFGITGRQWMINVSENAKALYAPVWVDIAVAKMRESIGHIYIVDSQGFEAELHHLEGLPGIDLLSISIEPPGTVPRGEKYQADDSRFNCAHLTQFVAQNSDGAVRILQNEMLNRNWIQRSL
jgi:hypothetical protein